MCITDEYTDQPLTDAEREQLRDAEETAQCLATELAPGGALIQS
jgi:hypothetical protein